MANRKSGSHDSMTGDFPEAEQARADAFLEDEHQDAVRRADRQQVQHDRLQRHHDRAEDHQQQQEAEPEHEREHERQVVLLRLDRVDGLRRRAADHDVGVDAVERGRDVVVAQPLERRLRLVAGEVARHRDRQQRQVAGLIRLEPSPCRRTRLPRATAVSCCDRRLHGRVVDVLRRR